MRLFTPTTRHASELLTPRAFRRANCSRRSVNGAGPCVPFDAAITTSNTRVLRRSLEFRRPQVGPEILTKRQTEHQPAARNPAASAQLDVAGLDRPLPAGNDTSAAFGYLLLSSKVSICSSVEDFTTKAQKRIA